MEPCCECRRTERRRRVLGFVAITVVAATANVILSTLVFSPDSWPAAIIGGLTVLGLLWMTRKV